MQHRRTLCLHFPVCVPANGRTFSGELYLPKAARSLRICVVTEDDTWCRRFGALLVNATTATLTLHSEAAPTAGELLEIGRWARSRRLLSSLAVRFLAAKTLARVDRADRRGARRAQRGMLRIRTDRQILPTAPALLAVGRT